MPEPEIDLSDFICSTEELRAAKVAISRVVPHRAYRASCWYFNRAFVVTDAIRALATWHAKRDNSLSSIVVLAGPPGTGKTTAVVWYAMNRLVEDAATGTNLHWYSAPALARMKRTGPEREEVVRSMEENVVIDDLGAEHVSGSRADDWRADVDELVDAIYRSVCGIALITTNLTAAELRNRYGARVADRLRECGTWIPVVGKSMRGKR
jgi:DNA replication protein DnaC